MAKQYQTRTNVAVRKKREEEAKRAKRRAFFRAHKKQIIAAAIALAIAIPAIWVAVDYFYAPAGSMRMFAGKLLDVQENALIRNLGTEKSPRYYTLGYFAPLEGYTLNPNYNAGTTGLETSYYYKADDAEKDVQAVYSVGVKNRGAEEMADSLIKTYNVGAISEKFSGVIGGHPTYYVHITNDVDTNDEGLAMESVCFYMDTVQNSCVLVNLMSKKAESLDQLPGMDVLMAEAEKVLPALTLP